MQSGSLQQKGAPQRTRWNNISIVGAASPLAFNTTDKGLPCRGGTQPLGFIQQFQRLIDITAVHRLCDLLVKVTLGVAHDRFRTGFGAGAAAGAGAGAALYAAAGAVLPTVTALGPDEPNSGPTRMDEPELVCIFSLIVPSRLWRATGSGISGTA